MPRSSTPCWARRRTGKRPPPPWPRPRGSSAARWASEPASGSRRPWSSSPMPCPKRRHIWRMRCAGRHRRTPNWRPAATVPPTRARRTPTGTRRPEHTSEAPRVRRPVRMRRTATVTMPGAELAGDGLVVVDKPPQWTSHDVVGRMRRLAGTRKVGHAGTLDPMATGVLVLGVIRATRLLTYLVGADKEYTATIRLGQNTLTDDAQGEVTHAVGAADPAQLRPRLPEQIASLTGPIDQVPSAVSAIKIDGQR